MKTQDLQLVILLSYTKLHFLKVHVLLKSTREWTVASRYIAPIGTLNLNEL